MTINIDAIKEIVSITSAAGWDRENNMHLLTTYVLKLDRGVEIRLLRWQDAGINLETGQLTGKAYDLQIGDESIDKGEFAEFHFKRVHELFEFIDSKKYAEYKSSRLALINDVVSNYKQGAKEQLGPIRRLFKRIFG